jgi:serine/alanine racemase
VQCGDVATLIGQDGEEDISADEMSAKAGTIPNELLSRLSGRIERIVGY